MLDILANIAIRAGDYRVAMQVRCACWVAWVCICAAAGRGGQGIGASCIVLRLSKPVDIGPQHRRLKRSLHPTIRTPLLPTPRRRCVRWS